MFSSGDRFSCPFTDQTCPFVGQTRPSMPDFSGFLCLSILMEERGLRTLGCELFHFRRIRESNSKIHLVPITGVLSRL